MFHRYRDDGSEPPDLSAIPMHLWAEALRPLLPGTRRRAIRAVPPAEHGAFYMVLFELEMEDADRHPSQDIPVPTLPDGADAAPAPPRRQVNFRMEAIEHERLRAHAAHLDMSPATLARLLVIRGVDQALRSRRTG